MKIEEILNYYLDKERGTLNVEFIIEENPEKTYYLELEESELENYCDLYESRDWVDSESEEILGLTETIDLYSLQEGLEGYLCDNTDCLIDVD
jgi:hypothetical protein